MPPECHRHHPYAAPHVPITNQTQRKTDGFGPIRNRNRTQVDYTASVVRHFQNRISHPDAVNNQSISFAAKFVRSCTNFKTRRAPTNRVLWTPSGRRVITGDQNGDFTLWDGESFHHELTVDGHEKAIRSMAWSYDDENWVSGDDGGAIKYWKSNMTNALVNVSAHQEAVRDLSFSRTNLMFCSCSDDTTIKIWDFETSKLVHTLTGHGWNVRSVDWHPTKSLVASGGKDSVVKLWDARTGRELCSFYDHKNWVHSVKWNPNGNLLLTASKDQTIKLFDMRTMKELESFRGHGNQVTALAWHPYHEEYFVSGSGDGSIFHWLVGQEAPQVEVPNAHNGSNNSSVWDLQWHPMGHLLCSGSNDRTTKFWCIGDHKSNINENKSFGALNSAVSGHMFSNFPIPSHEVTSSLFAKREGTIIPGVGIAV